jgi:hypothetical protein
MVLATDFCVRFRRVCNHEVQIVPYSPTGCASFGFLKYFPRHLNGSETETRANVLVSLTHPGVVTCAAFTPRTVVLPLPTVALIFEPVIDPFVAPENRTSVYNEDPVGRFFLSRSASVNITTASSSTAIPVFVSYLQSSGSRTIHITCAAKCAANSSVTAVSFPVPVMLKSCTWRLPLHPCVLPLYDGCFSVLSIVLVQSLGRNRSFSQPARF